MEMTQQLGLVHFWEQGDPVTHTTAVLLMLLSVASWYVMAGKFLAHLRYRMSCERVLASFWDAESLPHALEAIRRDDRTGIFGGVALSGARAAQAYQRQVKGIGGGVDASDFVSRALRQAVLLTQARIEHGLTFLASVGATAPFVGLFGTVWGIYHALVNLMGATQVVLDKVAGPVGEALLMTAGGLFVAIPAVLAYNAATRANRLVLTQIDGFAHDLHAFLTTGIRLQKPADNLVELVSVKATGAA
jgi:biopolymer transport protein ExbB